LISIVIPAHNEEALIGATLEALDHARAAIDEPSEVIVVDDDSTDRTGEIAAGRGAKVVRVALRHIAAVRNAGAAVAAGEVLVFVDADTIVPAATLRAVVSALDAGAVAGGAPARLDAEAPLWAKASWLPFQYAGPIVRLPGGAFMFMTRTAFDAAGGFDEQYFAGEEIFFARALKKLGPFRMVSPAVVTSGRKFRLLGFVRMSRIWLTLARHGMRTLKDRKHLGLWYDTHRDELRRKIED
jgi:glycosyltransferase involved in cell wall biosynthesis